MSALRRTALRRIARRRIALGLPALGALLVVLPAPTAAQDCTGPRACERPVPPWERRQRPSFGVSAAGLYSTVDGGDFRTVGDGFGFDAQGWVGVSGFALGVGYQRTAHTMAGAGDARATWHGPFVEPRLAFPLGYGAFVPYVAGRVARLTRSGAGATALDAARNGVQLGGGAGVLVTVAPTVALDLGGSYSRIRFDRGDADARGGGLLLRAGVVIAAGGER